MRRPRGEAPTTRRPPGAVSHHGEAAITAVRHDVYQVSNGSEQARIEGRADAIAEAKTLSLRSGRTVHVERGDGCVSMEFRRGQLQVYKFEMRGGRAS